MAQALQDIYNSLNSTYAPQRDLINQQLQQLPGQYDAQVQGLEGQKNIAFQGIDNQANARGMLYSGAPTQDDRNYTQATYLPAIANVRNQQNQAQYGLQSTLAQLGQQQQQQAYTQYNTGVQNDMTQNNLNQQIQLQREYNAGMLARSGGYGGGGGAAANNSYQVGYNNAGGLTFTNNGKAVTAAQYAQANGTTVASLLAQSHLASDQALAQKIAAARTPQQQAALKKQYSYIFGGV